MAELTFEEAKEAYFKQQPDYRYQRDDAFFAGWHARDAELAALRGRMEALAVHYESELRGVDSSTVEFSTSRKVRGKDNGASD